MASTMPSDKALGKAARKLIAENPKLKFKLTRLRHALEAHFGDVKLKSKKSVIENAVNAPESDSDSSSSSSSSEESESESSSSSSSSSNSDDSEEENEASTLAQVQAQVPAAPQVTKRQISDDLSAPPAKKQKTDSDQAPARKKPMATGLSNRVCCKNLAYVAEEKDGKNLKKFFSECGDVTDIHFVRDKETGQFYGTAFVTFASIQGAAAALKLNGEVFMRREIRIGTAKGGAGSRVMTQGVGKKPKGCLTVFLGNLSFDTEEETIRKIFEPCGPIKEVRWVEREDGTFTGAGFIEFVESNSTEKAVRFNGHYVNKRPMKVDYFRDTRNR